MHLLWTHVGFEPLCLRAKETCYHYTTRPIVLLLLQVGVTPIHYRVLPKACINLLAFTVQSQRLLDPSIPTEGYFRTFTIVIWRLRHRWAPAGKKCYSIAINFKKSSIFFFINSLPNPVLISFQGTRYII